MKSFLTVAGLATLSPRRQFLAVLALAIVAAAVMGPTMALAWAGDAVIHLRVAELLAQGHGFQFNLGEPVVATTSLMWTLILSACFRVLGPFGAVYAVKGLNILLWFLTAAGVAMVWGRLYRNSLIGLIGAAVFAFNPGVFQNAVNGMDAILLSFEQICLLGLVFAFPRKQFFPLVVIGAAAAALTRPEGIMFCLLLGGFLVLINRRISRETVGLIAGAAIGIIVSSSIYYLVSGALLPDSGAARIAAGLRESRFLGPIHFHPKSAVRFGYYLPLTLGLALAGVGIVRDKLGRSRSAGTDSPPAAAAAGFTVVLVLMMLFAYSFILGATHTSRYWIPFFPLIAGAAAGSLAELIERSRSRPNRKRLALLAAAGAVAWMAGIYAVEWGLRLKQGVGYDNHYVARAVENREEFTRTFFEQLGITAKDLPVKIAMTEVQVRYFLKDDGSVEILSLDGRAARGFSRYLEPKTGKRRFDLFLRENQPDFLEYGQVLPDEPILPQIGKQISPGSKAVIEVDGFRFQPTDYPGIVRYLHGR